MNPLNELYELAKVCNDCPLHRTRKNVVFGSGSPIAHVVFVADYPGKVEDEKGIPLIGEAGKFNDELLEFVGAEKDEFFWTNALLCKPSGAVTKTMIGECRKWVHEIIRIIDPVMVIAMGGVAAESLTGSSISVTWEYGNIVQGTIRGATIDYQIPVGILANPAFVLRDNNTSESSARHKQLWALGHLLTVADSIAYLTRKTPLPSRKLIDKPLDFEPLVPIPLT